MKTIKISTHIYNYVFFCIIAYVFFISFNIQSTFFLNPDVSWLIEASSRMLAGGNYTHHFFENNPPWIMYFYLPIVLLAKLLPISILTLAKLYFYFLAILSLSFCYFFASKLFEKEDHLIAHLFLLALAITSLIISMHEFGQREHLLYMLLMPYLFMTTARLQNKSVNKYVVAIVGCMAASVLLLKPYFLFPFLLVEIYFIYSKKNIFASFRTETMIIGLIALSYLALIFLRHVDYLTVVVPFSLRVCYLASKNLSSFILNDMATYCLITIVFFVGMYQINRFKLFTTIMLLAMIGFLFSYYLQQQHYYYRVFPAYAMAISLNVFFIACFMTSPHIKKYSYGFLILAILIYSHFWIYLLKINIPNPDNIIYFYIILMGCMTSLLIGAHFNHAFKYSLIAVIIFYFMFPPTYNAFVRYNYLSYMMKNNHQPLVNYMNQHAPHQSVYFMDVSLNHNIIAHTDSTSSASRFSGFWMISGLVKRAHLAKNPEEIAVLNQDYDLFLTMINEDIFTNKPKLIFVNSLPKQDFLFFNELIPFDFIATFKTNEQFAKIFKEYQYKTTLTSILPIKFNLSLFKVRLISGEIPTDEQIKSSVLHLYLNHNNTVEVALKDHFGTVVSIEIDSDNHHKKFISSIKQILSVPGYALNQNQKNLLASIISEHRVEHEVYRYDVYERMT